MYPVGTTLGAGRVLSEQPTLQSEMAWVFYDWSEQDLYGYVHMPGELGKETMTQSNAQSESPENLKRIYCARFLGAPSLSQRSLADSDQSRRAPSLPRYKQSRRPSLSLQQDETPARKPIEWRRTRVLTGSHGLSRRRLPRLCHSSGTDS